MNQSFENRFFYLSQNILRRGTGIRAYGNQAFHDKYTEQNNSAFRIPHSEFKLNRPYHYL